MAWATQLARSLLDNPGDLYPSSPKGRNLPFFADQLGNQQGVTLMDMKHVVKPLVVALGTTFAMAAFAAGQYGSSTSGTSMPGTSTGTTGGAAAMSFDQIDKNGDGQIGRSEWDSFQSSMGGTAGGTTGGTMGGTTGGGAGSTPGGTTGGETSRY
jgi:hypothetical protein